jgi:hypothetical protein
MIDVADACEFTGVERELGSHEQERAGEQCPRRRRAGRSLRREAERANREQQPAADARRSRRRERRPDDDREADGWNGAERKRHREHDAGADRAGGRPRDQALRTP